MVGDAPVFQMKRPGERPAPAKPFCSRKEFKTLVIMVVFFLVVLAYVAWQHAESAISRAEEARRVPAAIEQDPGRAAEPASSVVGVDSPRAADSPGVEAAGPVGSPSDEPPSEAPAGPVHEVMKPKGQEVKPPEGVARKDWIEEWVKKQKADFRPLEDEFEPADKLDADLLGTVIDDYNLPDDTSKIKDEADVFFHVVSFLRSHDRAQLREMAKGKKLSYADMHSSPDLHRGAVLRLTGVYIRDFQLQRWTTPERPENPAGLNDTWIVFVQDLKRKGALYAVVTCDDDKNQLRSDDLVTCEAVFVKRWCGQLADGRWRWMPLVVTKDLVKVKPPEGGIGPLKIAVAAIVFVGVVIIFFAARRELKGSAEAGAHLRQRQKVTKGLIAGQVKKLREEDLEADAETEADRAAAKIEEEAEADAGGEAPGEDAGSNSEAKSEDGSDGPSGGDDGASEEKPPGGGEAGEERSAEDQGDAGGSPDDGGDDSGEEKKD